MTVLGQAIDGLIRGLIADNQQVLSPLTSSEKRIALRDRILNHLRILPTPFRIGIGITILWFEFANWKSLYTFTRLSKRPTHEITDYLDHAVESSFPLRRWAFLGIKFICISQIYSDHEVLSNLGYDHALHDRQSGQCRH